MLYSSQCILTFTHTKKISVKHCYYTQVHLVGLINLPVKYEVEVPARLKTLIHVG